MAATHWPVTVTEKAGPGGAKIDTIRPGSSSGDVCAGPQILGTSTQLTPSTERPPDAGSGRWQSPHRSAPSSGIRRLAVVLVSRV